MKQLKHLPRIAAAVAFTAAASTAVVVAEATHAGAPATGLLAAAPQAASAGVSVGIGVNVGGPARYPRYAYRGGSWVRIGFGYASAPGYVGGYYLGYGPPAVGYYPAPVYDGPRYYPASYGRAYYGHPYYGHAYYGHAYYAHAYYGGHGYGEHGYGGHGGWHR